MGVIRRCLLAQLILIPTAAMALVDMRNANYSESWIDLQVKSSNYDLRVQRTYNSRTLFSGMFGFGWCSEFETSLKVTPENTLRVTECGAGMENEFLPAKFDKNALSNNVKAIMAEVRKRNKGKDNRYFQNLEAEVSRNSQLRDELARQLKITGKVEQGQKYHSRGKETDYIIFRGNEYSRTLADGSLQKFDKSGRLIQIADRNGNYLKINYKGDRIATVVDTSGASLTYTYHGNTKFVKKIAGPGNLAATYKFSKENLVSVVNAWKNAYAYAYDDLYNLTKVAYPDKTTVELTYDKDRDWVISFKDRNGCKETYAYKTGEKDDSNKYASSVTKVCGGKVTNKSEFEFWHKNRRDGSRYLARTKSTVNGRTSETVYHEEFGRPIQVVQNSVTTKYEYYPNGLMKRKYTAFENLSFKYDDRCKKVDEVVAKYQGPPAPSKSGRKPTKAETKTVTTKFIWDTKRCNLMAAKNSDGQSVQLGYDIRGRITKILDQAKRELVITYDDRIGKPATISRPGLGQVKFKYKPDGTVDNIDSNDDLRVASQLLNIFNTTLEIIAPAVSEGNAI